MADPVQIPDEAVEVAARALFEAEYRSPVEAWPSTWDEDRDSYRRVVGSVLRAAYPILAARILREVADECDAIRHGAETGEWLPTAEVWMRHRADQLVGEVRDA